MSDFIHEIEPQSSFEHSSDEPKNDALDTPPLVLPPDGLDAHLRATEARLIQSALTLSHGNKSKAAQLLQIKRSTLCDRIKRCGLK